MSKEQKTKYYYVVYSSRFGGNEVPDPKIITNHPLLFEKVSPVLFWTEISKELAEERKDLWPTNEV